MSEPKLRHGQEPNAVHVGQTQRSFGHLKMKNKIHTPLSYLRSRAAAAGGLFSLAVLPLTSCSSECHVTIGGHVTAEP